YFLKCIKDYCMISITCLLRHTWNIKDTVVPLIPVQAGESATFHCALPSVEYNQRDIHWYKQRPDDAMKRILKVLKRLKNTTIDFEPGFSDSRWKVNNDEKFIRLTLLNTTYSDQGLYHCELATWTENHCRLFFCCAENTVRISNNTVIQQLAVSIPVRSGDTATLHCSVLFDSEKMACSEDFSVFWFQAKSNNTYPNMIYTEGNKHHECKKKSDSEKSCMFNFSKVVNSSDSGIFYCAVTSCGKIFFGNGTRLEIVDNTSFESISLVTTVSCLVCSLILNIVLICYGTSRVVKKRSHGKYYKRTAPQADGENKNYATLNFSKSKKNRGGKKKRMEPQECFYSGIKKNSG
uniref:Ig-like domain-containing protein n=1 Tax=Poecilia formosa TaxID=48698 RepID=A0A096MER5_POEFO